VNRFIQSLADSAQQSDASVAVKTDVVGQLNTIQQRLAHGKIDPTIALKQANIWSRHLNEDLQTLAQTRVKRASLNPFERIHRAGFGAGMTLFENAAATVSLAKGTADLSPQLALHQAVSNTVANAMISGDLAASINTGFGDQWSATTQAASSAIQGTAQGVQSLAQLGGDIATVIPNVDKILAKTLINTVETGDFSQSYIDAVVSSLTESKDSASRLGRVLWEISG